LPVLDKTSVEIGNFGILINICIFLLMFVRTQEKSDSKMTFFFVL